MSVSGLGEPGGDLAIALHVCVCTLEGVDEAWKDKEKSHEVIQLRARPVLTVAYRRTRSR